MEVGERKLELYEDIVNPFLPVELNSLNVVIIQLD